VTAKGKLSKQELELAYKLAEGLYIDPLHIVEHALKTLQLVLDGTYILAEDLED